MKKITAMVVAVVTATVATVAIGRVIMVKGMQGDLEKSATRVAQYIKDNKNSNQVAFALTRNGEVLASVNADHAMPLASMSKWTVAIAYANQVSRGIIDPDERIDVAVLDRYYIPNTDGGAHPGWLAAIEEKGLLQNNQTTIREVARGMIMFSSNANTDYLMYRLGIDNINQTIKEMGLSGHSQVYPIVAAICLGDYLQQETGLLGAEVKEQIINMSDEDYVANIIEIHEKMNRDELPQSVREVSLIFNDLDFQKIWSDRFISATANDYLRMMELINSGTYLDERAQKELSLVVEYLMETPGFDKQFKHFGMKGGSTGWVLTDARYAEDVSGNKTQVVVMFNELDAESYQMVLQSMDHLMTFSIIDDKIREDVVGILK